MMRHVLIIVYAKRGTLVADGWSKTVKWQCCDAAATGTAETGQGGPRAGESG